MTRSTLQLLPSFTAELEEIRKSGITKELLQKIIQKHKQNADFNKKLYNRYMAVCDGVEIFSRQPRYEEEENPINNKINNDFFGEIVDFKVGYFAGKPAEYGYCKTEEAEQVTGGKEAVEKATKAVTDFVTRNNMFDIDMETTKRASICGYTGRLFYIDKEGNERVTVTDSFETISLSDTDPSEPECAVRYYKEQDIDGIEKWTAIFYDNKYMHTFKGDLLSLEFVEKKEHLFDYCPLQVIVNNKECMGDAERVIALIDAYDRTVSDNSNEIESFAHAYMLFTYNVDDSVIEKAQKTGALIVPQVGTGNGDPVKFLTKNINDGYTENHLNRLEDNIYRFSKTPNLGDEAWGNASGVSLKFKLHGLEVKCAQFQAKMMNAAQYMWKVLASSWAKKGIKVDPLQCVASYDRRNFPLDHLSNAQTAQAMIAAGIPAQIAWGIAIPEIDDVDYVIEVKKQEQEEAMELYEAVQKEQIDNANNAKNKEETEEEETEE